MPTISTFECGKSIRKIFETSTDASLNELKARINSGLFRPQDFDFVKIDYNCFEGLPYASPNNPDYYPVKFISNSENIEVWLSAVSAGYRGEGPHGTVEALRIMGFELTEYDKEQIFTTKNAHLTFTK